MKQIIWIVIVISLGLLPACREVIAPDKQVLAKINGRDITVTEFREFYELDPNFGIDSSGTEALRDELNFFAHQIRALKKAESSGLAEDPIFRRAIEWEQRQAMLRQLFRDRVEAKISVTEKELADLYVKQRAMVHVRQLFVSEPEQMDRVQESLGNGFTFERIASEIFLDSTLAANGGDLGWVQMSDLDEDFGRAVDALGVQQISEPFRTKWGYHIVQLVDRKEQVILNENEFISQKKSLEKKIRQIKSRNLSREYVRRYMVELNPQPVEKAFRKLWQAIVPSSQRESHRLENRQMLSNYLLDGARQSLADHQNSVLISCKNGDVTIGDFLNGMEKMPSGQRPRFKSHRELSNQMAIWMRDEILFKEAKGIGLGKHGRVLAEVGRFAEEQSYYFYLNQISDSLTVPDDISAYFNNVLRDNQNHPERLRRYHTLQEWKWDQARIRLWAMLQSDTADLQIDEHLLHQENASIDWSRRIRMFMVRKPQ